MYKLIITAGCSFSAGGHTWVCDLESYYLSRNPSCEFLHLAVPSQSNELIQKKATRAVLSALDRFKPEDIALFVMWSTHDRRAFYLPDSSTDRLVDLWTLNIKEHTWRQQFADLDNKILARDGQKTGVAELGSGAGWYHMHGSTMNSDIISKTYYDHVHSLELGVHVTLENMLILDLLVSRLGIFSCSMLIMTSVYDSIVQHRQHNLCEHLYSAVDWTKFDLQGEYDYLRSQLNSAQYFTPDGLHPNRRGHSLWFQQQLLPRLADK